MRKIQILSILVALIVSSCGNGANTSATQTMTQNPEIDTAKVLAVFDSLKNDSVFVQRSMAAMYASRPEFYSGERPILIGDINGDGRADALMPFAVEYTDRDDERTNKSYYAVLLNHNGNLAWEANFDRENFSGSYYYPDQAVTVEKIEKYVIRANLSASFEGPKTPILFEWYPPGNTFQKIQLNSYYWHYDDLKLNGKYPLNVTKKEILTLVGKPDSVITYFRDCNEGGGPKEVYYFETLALEFGEDNTLDNDEYQFDNNQNLSITFNKIKLDKHTTYDDVLKLSPDILKQQPPYEEDEGVDSGALKMIYIPLREKIVADEYDGLNWIILKFHNGYLQYVIIPSANCEI